MREVFVSLYNKGLIYRGEYIINWDPSTKTALSDIEVIYKDVQGAFYHMKYPLVDGSDEIEIATTRPETMLGDTAVAVHPEDDRYKHLIGKKVRLPITGRKSRLSVMIMSIWNSVQARSKLLLLMIRMTSKSGTVTIWSASLSCMKMAR